MSYLQTSKTIIKNKVGPLNLAEELGKYLQGLQSYGVFREITFYRYKKAVENGGVDSLLEKNPEGIQTLKIELLPRSRRPFLKWPLKNRRGDKLGFPMN